MRSASPPNCSHAPTSPAMDPTSNAWMSIRSSSSVRARSAWSTWGCGRWTSSRFAPGSRSFPCPRRLVRRRPDSDRATRRWLGERSALGELLGVDFETMGAMQLYRVNRRPIVTPDRRAILPPGRAGRTYPRVVHGPHPSMTNGAVGNGWISPFVRARARSRGSDSGTSALARLTRRSPRTRTTPPGAQPRCLNRQLSQPVSMTSQ